MVLNEFKNIAVEGIQCAVPGKWISIESLKDGQNNDTLDKFVKTTNVHGHYECSKRQTAADLSCVAAESLIEKKGIVRDEIGVLVFVTQYPDYKMPSTACVLQHRLGLSINCIAFDVNLGCSGYVYGMNIVSSLMQSSNCKYGLLLAGDTSSKGVRTDNSRNLFGDAGSATLLTKTDEEVKMCFASKTMGSGFKALLRPFGAAKHMDKPDTMGMDDGIAVFNFAIDEAPRLMNEFMAETGLTPDDFDCLALHQANMLIMKQIVKRIKFDKSKMLVSLDRFANTSCTSIPLCLAKEYGEKNEDRNIHALICGFGVGLSLATGNINVNVKDVLPLIETDEYFDDGLFEE